MKKLFVILTLLLGFTSCANAVIALSASTDSFNPLQLGGPSDPTEDNQANRVDLELVGRPENGLEAFYIKFDNEGDASTTDGDLAFRIRLSGNTSQNNVGGGIYVGLDITGDGALDYFVAHQGKNDQNISIFRAGSGSNNSPSSLTLGDSLFSESTVYDNGSNLQTANISFVEVEDIDPGLTGVGYDPYDLDAGSKKKSGADYFLTFKIDFADLVAVIVADAESGKIDSQYSLFDDTSVIQMLVVSSQNTNNINSDFGGIDDNSRDPNLPFNDPDNPGGTSVLVDVGGNPVVPEPRLYALCAGLFVFVLCCLFRR